MGAVLPCISCICAGANSSTAGVQNSLLLVCEGDLQADVVRCVHYAALHFLCVFSALLCHLGG